MKNSNVTIGNRTRDLPPCSAVPQPTVPQRAPVVLAGFVIKMTSETCEFPFVHLLGKGVFCECCVLSVTT
jgi:hypothetical protein